MKDAPVLAAILVVCNDPRHARGRVAKIATITVYENGNWGVDTQEAHQRRHLDRAKRKLATGQARNLFGGKLRGCKLCGSELPPGSVRAFRQAVWGLATRGETVVSLAELDALIVEGEEP